MHPDDIAGQTGSGVCAAVMPGTKLQEHTGSEKAWVWSAVDFADEVQKPELFCIRFASVERELTSTSVQHKIAHTPIQERCWHETK